jgi:WD40 repeat protein
LNLTTYLKSDLTEKMTTRANHHLLAELYSDLHACSIESIDNGSFLCGLYELNEKEQIRNGRLIICDIKATLKKIKKHEYENNQKVVPEIVVKCSIDTNGGVLDCKIKGNTNTEGSGCGNMVATVLSTGRLDLYNIVSSTSQSLSQSKKGNNNDDDDNDDDDDVAFEHIGTASDIDSNEGMFLSLDWQCGSTGYYPHNLYDQQQQQQQQHNAYNTSIAVSTQQGNILIYDTQRLIASSPSSSPSSSSSSSSSLSTCHTSTVIPTVTLSDGHAIYGENVPCWIVSYDPHSIGNRIASGGDDCKLNLWDVRMPKRPCASASAGAGASACASTVFKSMADENGDEDEDESEIGGSILLSNKKSHHAGVTSAQWHPYQENILVTGSYDKNLRLWDCRNISKPIWEDCTDGGIWRSKWWVQEQEQQQQYQEENNKEKKEKEKELGYFGAACMHGGSTFYDMGTYSHSDFIRSPYRTGMHYAPGVTEQGHLSYGLSLLNVGNFNDNYYGKYITSIDGTACAEVDTANETEAKTEVENERWSVGNGDGQTLAASCSFYDNLIQLWTVPTTNTK